MTHARIGSGKLSDLLFYRFMNTSDDQKAKVTRLGGGKGFQALDKLFLTVELPRLQKNGLAFL
ncbi:hypothetical protein D3C85_1635810 [compost metagenome]